MCFQYTCIGCESLQGVHCPSADVSELRYCDEPMADPYPDVPKRCGSCEVLREVHRKLTHLLFTMPFLATEGIAGDTRAPWEKDPPKDYYPDYEEDDGESDGLTAEEREESRERAWNSMFANAEIFYVGASGDPKEKVGYGEHQGVGKQNQNDGQAGSSFGGGSLGSSQETRVGSTTNLSLAGSTPVSQEQEMEGLEEAKKE